MLGFTRGFADGTRRQAMRLMARSIALAVVVSLFISGPLGTFARAQQPAEQPAQPPAEQPAPQPAEQPAPQPAEQPAPPPAEPTQAIQPTPPPAEQPMQAAPQPAPPAPQPAQMPAPPPAPMPEPQPAQQTAQQPQPRQELPKREDYESSAPYIMGDRKSTRLNSSHSQISYAVFCLKKKKNTYDASSYQTSGNQIESSASYPQTIS